MDDFPDPFASRRSAERLIELAAVVMLVLDTDGRVKFINPKGCEILGHGVADILDKVWFDHFLPEDTRNDTRRVFHRLVNGEEELVRHYDNPILTASGEIRHIEWHNALLRDSRGHITGILSSGQDVTENHRKTEALRTYERIVSNLPDYIAIVDRDYSYRLVNEAYTRFHDRPREEIEGRSIAELFDREQFEATIRPGLDRCFAGESIHQEAWFDIPGIGHRCKAVVYTPYTESDGTVSGAIIRARDETKRCQAEEALRDSESQYRALFHGNSDAIFLHGILPSGEPDRFLKVNEAACRILGYTESELLNLSPQDIDAAGMDEQRVVAIHSLMVEGHTVFEMEHLSKDGRTIPVEISARLIDVQGQPMVLSMVRNVTERRQSLQTLKSHQEYIHILLDTMAEGMYGVDTRGFCTFVNQSFLRMLGYERAEDLLGRHIHELIHHSHADGSPYPSDQCHAYHAFLENRKYHVDDEVFWRRDGTCFPVEYWSYPMWRNGENVGSVVTFQDISERRRTADKLRAARQMLQHVIDTVPNYVFWKDRDLRYLGCNDAFARLAGLQVPDELVGKNDHDLIWHRFADLYRHDDAEVIATGTSKLNLIEPLELEDGTTLWLETSKVPLRDAQSRIIGMLGVFQDISERMRSEEKLRQAAKVFESTMEGVMVTDPEGKIVAVNAAFTEITGYTEPEALGRNPRIRQSGRHDKSFYQAMWASILQDGSWRGEIWNRRKTGEIYPEWLTINTVRDDAGNVANYVGVFADISQLKRSEADLDYLAHHDPLTELPNRLLFNARLDYAIQRARRAGTALAVLFLDLDRFKTVNDSLGHPVGDTLLRKVAALLSASVRNEDTVARLGGDEFVIVLEGVRNTGDASAVAENILFALNKRFDLDGQAVFISASIGISMYPADGDDVTTLLQNSDAAMYRSKEEGRNTFRFYSTELTRTAHERLTLETALRRAIDRQEFVLHFQPQVDVINGAIVGAEALVRWLHPQSGFISPMSFIPLAEETGLILPLGDWVLYAACEQHQAWLAEGLPPITLAVNLSPRQFQHRNLLAQLRAVLDATGLPPRLLELEITEGAIMERGEAAVSTLCELKKLGLKMAIDDFGTGYSSLAYLRRFPIDTLKIDRSFMRDIPRESGAREIAATIIAMARNLHMKVLAEGVETLEQLAFLQRHGCDTYQGFLNSRPVSAESFAELLRTGPVNRRSALFASL